MIIPQQDACHLTSIQMLGDVPTTMKVGNFDLNQSSLSLALLVNLCGAKFLSLVVHLGRLQTSITTVTHSYSSNQLLKP
jgi:hypothetical protein